MPGGVVLLIVDDPSSLPHLYPSEEQQDEERQRLFRIIEHLVRWENSSSDTVLHAARTEIARSVARTSGVELPAQISAGEVSEAIRQYAPPVVDPFSGGGTIPLEAQRLGLRTLASDLNPVAVLISKALVEIPPLFSGRQPVNPDHRRQNIAAHWKRAAGLSADILYYGKWLRDEAQARIGYLYPNVDVPRERGGGSATVIAWLWTRTMPCPNPACGIEMPLVRSFSLSSKKNRQAFARPTVDVKRRTVVFDVVSGGVSPRDGTIGRHGAECLACGTSVPFPIIREAGLAGRLSFQLLAVVAEGPSGRMYLPPDDVQVSTAAKALSNWKPDAPLPDNTRDIRPQLYGLPSYGDLFTPRQLTALSTFSNLIAEVLLKVERDAVEAGMDDDGIRLADGGHGAAAYADAIATYIAFALDKLSDWCSATCSWIPSIESIKQTFARQAIPMVWDPAEVNVFSSSVGNFMNHVEWVAAGVAASPADQPPGSSRQHDATSESLSSVPFIACTDPPYYDNIGYSDLSDFFYVWMRKSLGSVWPGLFHTLLTPKSSELIAAPYRVGGDKHRAERFFEDGLADSFRQLAGSHDKNFPVTIFYAFKQAETVAIGDGGASFTASTGWETMLEALMKVGFSITGTMPLRTERDYGMKTGSNVLASSIVLVCRPRDATASVATRSEFVRALKRELPAALLLLQHGNIAPVDLAQASIGPGMAVFSRYAKVLETNGDPMRVRTALQLINQTLDEVLTEQEGEFDTDTRWAVSWFDQYGSGTATYGDAETLARAKDSSVAGLVDAGILEARAGKVRLLSRDELNPHWNPQTDRRPTIWEATQHLIRLLEQSEVAAADLMMRLGDTADAARDLAYRLYSTCERKRWAEDALAYNSLVVAWPELQRLAAKQRTNELKQERLV